MKEDMLSRDVSKQIPRSSRCSDPGEHDSQKQTAVSPAGERELSFRNTNPLLTGTKQSELYNLTKGGILGGPYYRITIEGTQRALAATADKEITTVPVYTGDDSQLWRVEQLVDGTFRLMPKTIPGTGVINKRLCLYSAGDSTPTLADYDFGSDNSKWNFRNH